MSAIKPPTIRHLTSRTPPRIHHRQKRWARVQDVRFVATHQDSITDRYRDKLDRKAKEQGLNNIGQLKEAYRDQITDLKKKASVSGQSQASDPTVLNPAGEDASRIPSHTSSPWPTPPPPPPSTASPHHGKANAKVPPGVKTLSHYLDVPKALALPQRELEALWRLRHADSKQSLSATIPLDLFSTMQRTAKRHPQFILPGLPQKVSENPDPGQGDEIGRNAASKQHEGAPIHFLQWTFPAPDTATVMFTHLAEYKLRGEHAQPHTILTHHLELAGAKGLVLCQGSVVPDRGVGVEEGRWLVLQLQRFYNIGEDAEQREEGSRAGLDMKRKRRRLVEMFSKGDAGFRVEELLEEAERLG